MQPPSNNPKASMLVPILENAAPKVGAAIHVEPEWRYAGQITFASGNISYFRGSSLDINAHGASEIAKDKGFSTYFLHRAGFNTIPGDTFYSDEWCKTIKSHKGSDAAVSYAASVGYPLIVKPNDSSQGRGVFLVFDEDDLRDKLTELFVSHRIVIVQRYIPGKDYRIVVLGNSVISAYERIPLNVVGDGASSIDQLLNQKQESFYRLGRNTRIPFDDMRIPSTLARSNFSIESVPPFGHIVYLLNNANLSSGGDAIDVTSIISEQLKRECIRITKAMGLQLCGVDLIVSGDVSDTDSTYSVVEVNSSPGLDNYSAIGVEQRRRVEDMYVKVLRYIDQYMTNVTATSDIVL